MTGATHLLAGATVYQLYLYSDPKINRYSAHASEMSGNKILPVS
jgi:hypothetical protein